MAFSASEMMKRMRHAIEPVTSIIQTVLRLRHVYKFKVPLNESPNLPAAWEGKRCNSCEIRGTLTCLMFRLWP